MKRPNRTNLDGEGRAKAWLSSWGNGAKQKLRKPHKREHRDERRRLNKQDRRRAKEELR